MTNGRFYVTTAIPYVNGAPHLGHALELVQADVLARHHRRRGRPVRSLTGTDDNALKNVAAAHSAGVPVHEFVAANASRFAALRDQLALSLDDFISTSRDPRHRPGVEELWRRIAARGDFYRRRYDGLYCIGCEQFCTAAELDDDGRCAEHDRPAEHVSEQNWFFRLSRYAAPLLAAIESGKLRIEPATKRNEVLAFIRAGLDDISVSRLAARADGWGIPVPDDPEQVIYVWWDALANYVTALDFGTDAAAYDTWWAGSAERVHIIGKGIVRFHAVHWPALLLAAGQPLPTTIVVHDYVSVAGAKISKSSGTDADPAELSQRYGIDALRWWLVREVPRVGDVDFTVERLVERHDRELANAVGNLANRTVTLVHKFRDGVVDLDAELPDRPEVLARAQQLPSTVDRHLAAFDFRAATEAIRVVAEAGNRLVDAERPWELARAERAGDAAAGPRLDAVLSTLIRAGRIIAAELAPFVPDGAARLAAQLGADKSVGEPGPVFSRSTTVA
ncbi:methionine--tRNA ligase [Haloactinopolyspora sp.]|uniref:methionine--tRNA ligase n=1 Tax=Haloactinopolyspora sp. TaxID=1966353 RepID=UPI00261CD711|nr:methionine--tRNA ligase [Haloactinopolyspora sp.]